MMELSKAELAGPWVFILECGHNSGSAVRVNAKRNCAACDGALRVVECAMYGKRRIPLADLRAARMEAQTVTPDAPTVGEYDRDALVAYIESRVDSLGRMVSMHIDKAKFPTWVWEKLVTGPYLYELECGHFAQSTTGKSQLHKNFGCVKCGSHVQTVVAVEVDGVKYPRSVVSQIRRSNGGNPIDHAKRRTKKKRRDAELNAMFGSYHDHAKRLRKQLSPELAAQVAPWYQHGHHRQYHAKLIAEGCTPELADKATMDYRWNGLRERAGDERYQRIRERLDGAYRPSDAQYRPRSIDPLLKGVARATGETAKAVRSGKTITDWQHRERTA